MTRGKDRGPSGGDAKIVIDDLITKKVQVKGVHPNVEQEVILITEDKVRLCLNENFHRAARSKQWATVSGMILTLLLTLTTAQFRDFGGLSSQEWRGVMIAALVLSIAWFAVTVRWAAKSPTIETIVEELKEGSQRLAKEERVVNVGDEEYLVLEKRAVRSLLEDASGLIGPLSEELGPVPDDVRKALIISMQAFRTAS